MADDHIIRVILEGKDNLSGVFSGTRKELEAELGKMQKAVGKLRRDLDRPQEARLAGGKSGIFSSQGIKTVEQLNKEISRATKNVEAFKRALNSPVRNALFDARRGLGDFVNSFKQARQETDVIEENIRKALSNAREDRQARRAAVDEETRLGQIRVNQRKEELIAGVKGIIAQKKALNELNNQKLELAKKANVKQRNDDRDLEKLRLKGIRDEAKEKEKTPLKIAGADLTAQLKSLKKDEESQRPILVAAREQIRAELKKVDDKYTKQKLEDEAKLNKKI